MLLQQLQGLKAPDFDGFSSFLFEVFRELKVGGCGGNKPSADSSRKFD